MEKQLLAQNLLQRRLEQPIRDIAVMFFHMRYLKKKKKKKICL